jgi:3-phytase
VFLNSTDGSFVQYAVSPEFEITEVRRFSLASQVEGCVVDDSEAVIYIAEEDRGIWRMSASAEGPGDRQLLDSVRGDHLDDDVEGLALYHGPRKLLIASSQGNNSYAVYDAETAEHLLSFHVEGNQQVDGTTDTDGLDVTAASLPDFPHGILVVQDGDNTQPAENQNFKIISWSDVQEMIESQ